MGAVFYWDTYITFDMNQLAQQGKTIVEIMIGGCQRNLRAYLDIIFDDNPASRHHGAIMVNEYIFPDLNLATKIDINRR